MDIHEITLEASPEIKANPISKLFILWVFPLFRKGAKTDLNLGDVYQNLSGDSSSKLGTILEKHWNKEVIRATSAGRKPRLWKAVRDILWKRYTLIGLAYCFDELGLRTIQPLVLKSFIRTFQENTKDPEVQRRQYIYATGLVLVTLCHAILFQKLVGITIHIGMQMRLAVSSLIYRKILKLRKADSEHANVGRLINLLSSDVSRFDQGFNILYAFITSPIQLIIYSYLLWDELGVSSLGGIGCILFILPVEVMIGRFSLYFRTRIARRTDERGRFLNEIIGGIRLIKVYAWEKPFASVVAKLRRDEIKFIRRHLYLRGMFVSVLGISAKLIPFCALITYVWLGNTLTADKVFFSISVFNTIIQAIMNRIPNAASQTGEMLASMNRIEHFMLSKDNTESRGGNFEKNIVQNGSNPVSENDKGVFLEPCIVMENHSASWTEAQQTLKELSVCLRGKKLVMVVGNVGSGKSSFLNAILSELPIISSTESCQIQGSFSYASQEPWIFPASLRQNILFGLEMDDERYWRTIKLCCLTEDLKQFPHGDMTIVGERGVALSGGQKARVNMARAIYQNADIYLLDDPLSAVDTKVNKRLFKKCIKDHLKEKLTILVTHQLQYMPMADHIIVLNREGGIWSQGTYDELKNSDIDFTSLISEEYLTNQVDDDTPEVGGKPRKRLVSTQSRDDDKNDSTEQKGLLNDAIVQRNEEQKISGSVEFGTYFRYFSSGGSYLVMILLTLGFPFGQILTNFVDYWLSLWTNSVSTDMDSGKGRNSTIPNILLNITRANDTLIKASDDILEDPSDKQNLYAYVYCGLIAAFIVTTVFRSIMFFKYSMRISINLHDSMFGSLVRAPVKFFDDNPSGRIMNRFTKDLNQIDEALPVAFYDFIQIFLSLLGMLAINIAANYYTVVPSIILLFSLLKLRRFYLSSARDLKRIESLAKSPVFTHVTMTVHGLATIRAAKAEARVLDQFEKIQDTHTSVFYLIIMTNRFFAMSLEIMSAAYLAVVVFGFLFITSSTETGSVGVGITAILSLAGALQWGIRQSAETENHMTSVERAFEYCNLEPEAPLQSPNDGEYLKHWPKEGRINFQNVSLAYDDLGENKVLNDISFCTKPQEKVGIVGRTGAGKSSIITALFRLTEPQGEISIDDVSINEIGLHSLRSKISIIPQDPVLFTGSLRYNLDPFTEFSDDQLWRVLQEVDLHHSVQTLDYAVADGGSNFSVGQRQLVCLARAILRKNKILVMDEATANVDPVTDHLVQHTIRTKFSDCTILTIAHRLQSVIDNDRIMVLDLGKVLEFDTPEALLQKEDGTFAKMMKQYGTGDIS